MSNSVEINLTEDDIQELIASDTIMQFGLSNSGIVGTVISAGEDRKLYAVYGEDAARALYNVFNEFEFTVCYKSVYDSYWNHIRYFSNNRNVSTLEESKGCDFSEEQYFNDVLEL